MSFNKPADFKVKYGKLTTKACFCMKKEGYSKVRWTEIRALMKCSEKRAHTVCERNA